LPRAVCYGYLQLLGKLYYLTNRRERHLIAQNIRDMLGDRDPAYVKGIVRQTFKGIFAHYYEKMFSAFRGVKSIRKLIYRQFTIRNRHLIDEALAQKRGLILVTAHWGAVEFIPWVLGLLGYPISVVVECTTRRLEQALREKTKYADCELITGSSNVSVFYRALRSLKNNRLLMTECDEVDAWRRRKDRTIDLFGRKLFFDNTLDVMARRTGSPVVGVFLKRVSRSRYTLICEPVGTAERGETAKQALELWQKYVTMHPEQWYQWKKWKKMQAVS
jgi:lauroyl/myristoyl acyltransferase